MRSVIAASMGVVVGLWMMAAPAVLGYSGSGATSDRIVGPTAAAVAWIAATEVTRPMRWVNVPLGAWAIVAPLLLDYPQAGTVHSITSGVLLIGTALAIEPLPRQKFAGGWKALFEDRDDEAPEGSG